MPPLGGLDPNPKLALSLVRGEAACQLDARRVHGAAAPLVPLAHLPGVKRADVMGYHARRLSRRLRATPSPWDVWEVKQGGPPLGR